MRLFIAVPVNEKNKLKIQEKVNPLKERYPLSWVRLENYHITLQFLGEVKPEDVEKIDSLLSEIGVSEPPFDLTLSSLDFFPSNTKHRAIIVSIKHNQEIMRLADAVREKMRYVDFVPDKVFNVHLTVARIKENQRNQKFTLMDNKIDSVLSVQSFSLIESILKKEGPVYTDINSYTLRGGL